ncbi:helix-turn-helix transcriptional regulator [Mycobacterium yunnanensis]|uniref:Helix-turn-helix transcriptional regulator n=2 Tax=Mycobacterium yunnanensis TaxID=368477 RepID=A0A9X3BVS6_9MYCO|nr:helix-turn-helix transcriptional regulator [Mycobacterium yunnanensis]
MRHIEAAIAAPRLSGVVVAGPAGVGKSRIVREALAVAAARGCATRWAVGTSSARSVPLGAFAEWAQPGVAQPVQLVRGVIESLAGVPAQNSGMVLGVDDVHLLDELSTFVVHQLVRRNAGKVVLTVRDGEPIPLGVQEIWRDAEFERLELEPLTREETSALLSTTLGGPLNPDVAERLWRLTRGNALYLHNIVERGLTDGVITRRDGQWHWHGDPVVPTDLVDLIEARIGALPAAVSEVVDVLAVAEPVELASLQRITDPGAVELADDHGLVTVEAVDGVVEVRVAHPLYGEVRRRRAPPTRLRRLRALVANELANGDRRNEIRVVVRRASLSLHSDLEPDPVLLLSAARGAVWLADLPLSDRLAEAAIRAGGGLEAYLARAYVLSWLGRGADSDDALTAIPAAELTAADVSRIAFLRATNMLCAMADPVGAKRIVDDAAAVTPAPARGCLDAFLAVHWAAIGEPEKARLASDGLALDRLPAIVAAVTAWATTIAAGDAGRTTAALAAATTGYAIAAGSFDAAQMRFVIADGYVGALLLAGRIADAVDATEKTRVQAVDVPGLAQILSTALAGRTALAAGRLDLACSLLAPAVEVVYSFGDTNGFGYQYNLPYTVALAMRGFAADAAASFARPAYPSWKYLDYEYDIAGAWVAACRGATGDAARVARAGAQTACTKGQFAAEVMCLQTATQFGDASCGPRLRELEHLVEGPRAGAAARYAAALKDRDGGALAAVSEEFERMGDLVAAVDAASHAAVAYRDGDLRGSSLGCSARAEALAKRCGGARTPAFLQQSTAPLPLTQREREIVVLLGDGLSSRAVADRLTLSVRTVESHVYNAMAKTGTTSRDELAALVRPPEPTETLNDLAPQRSWSTDEFTS